MLCRGQQHVPRPFHRGVDQLQTGQEDQSGNGPVVTNNDAPYACPLESSQNLGSGGMSSGDIDTGMHGGT